MFRSKVAVAISQIIEIIELVLGIVILFFGGMATLMGLLDPEFFSNVEGEFVLGYAITTIVMCVLLDGVGILLIVCSRKRHKLVKDFRKYVTVLSQDPTGMIANMAASLNTSPDVVIKRIEKMIDKRLFVNAYIDTSENRLVLANTNNLGNQQNQETAEQKNPRIGYVTVNCSGCGGLNKIVKGTKAECEYCGMIINTK